MPEQESKPSEQENKPTENDIALEEAMKIEEFIDIEHRKISKIIKKIKELRDPKPAQDLKSLNEDLKSLKTKFNL